MVVTPDPCPEHAKLEAVSRDSQVIGEFLEWLGDEKGIHLGAPIEKLLAEYFRIDLKVLDDEKRAMAAQLRAQQT